MRILLLVVLFCSFLAQQAIAQSREEKVRNDRLRVSKSGLWHYNDLNAGFLEASRLNKPLMVVFRCIPCVECVKLDDDLMEQNPVVLDAMKRFVRVRQVSNNGIDLTKYQFDFDQSFTVLFFHPDGTLIGRYGTRSHHSEWKDDVSIEGLGASMQQVLQWFDHFESMRDRLAGKQSSLLQRLPGEEKILSPEQYPHLTKYDSKLDFDGPQVVKSCIHCHQIGDAQKTFALSRTPTADLPPQLLFPYPHPKILGLKMDVNQCATIEKVESGSIADKSGLRAGDRIIAFQGQPPVSMADLQWVLHNASNEPTSIKVDVMRNEQPVSLEMFLPNDWKSLDDISWRVSTWELRRLALGGMVLQPLTPEERKELGLTTDRLALRIGHVGQYAPHDRAKRAGLQKGDVVVRVAGKDDLLRETDIIRYLLKNRRSEDMKIPFEVLRDGKRLNLEVANR